MIYHCGACVCAELEWIDAQAHGISCAPCCRLSSELCTVCNAQSRYACASVRMLATDNAVGAFSGSTSGGSGHWGAGLHDSTTCALISGLQGELSRLQHDREQLLGQLAKVRL